MSPGNAVKFEDFAASISTKSHGPMAFGFCFSGHIAQDVSVTNSTKTWGTSGLVASQYLRAMAGATEYGQ
jgi:hypothetical protein